MEQLKNPFVIYGYKGAEHFCDRKKRDRNATRNMSKFIQLLAKTVVGQVDTFSQATLRKVSSYFSSYRPTVSFE